MDSSSSSRECDVHPQMPSLTADTLSAPTVASRIASTSGLQPPQEPEAFVHALISCTLTQPFSVIESTIVSFVTPLQPQTISSPLIAFTRSSGPEALPPEAPNSTSFSRPEKSSPLLI